MSSDPAPGRARAVLASLTSAGVIGERLLIVVAHPDDETIALGGQMWRMRDALLVHLTDGAPRDGEDARKNGFGAFTAYAAARQDELAAALAAGQAGGVRNAAMALPDKEAMLNLTELTGQLLELLRREQPVAVLTHAYEGGHPDHDAAAFAVHTACRLLAAANRPAIIEMPFYHAHDGAMVTGRFLPSSNPEITVPIEGAALQRKQLMADCFHTQREMLGLFDLSPERFRLAPSYDFRQPPHKGSLLYEFWRWGITGADWRRYAAEALETLGLAQTRCR
jgi:N-acetylglucosamine malate deacetylase 2